MKFAWSSLVCLLVIHSAAAIFKDLFKPRPHDDKPSLLDILAKPKLPSINIHLGGGSFGFNLGLGGNVRPPPGTGVHLPPKDEAGGERPGKPDFPWMEEKKDPRPNWGGDQHPKPGPYEGSKEDYPKPGSSHPKPGSKDYPKPGPYDDDSKGYAKPDIKDSLLPDWEDIGEKNGKSESMMDGDLVGDGLIQPRLNRRHKRAIESRVYHVPLTFLSNAKPYKVNINPNSLTKGKSKD